MFRFCNRNQPNNLVLIPGWAFDYRIFATLELPYNYFLFDGGSPVDFQDHLEELLMKNSLERISLLGWSQGAFAVCDFACKRADHIEEIFLISSRKKYQQQALQDIGNHLNQNKTAYLYSFYKECFCKDENDRYRWFKQTLQKDYLDRMSLAKLVESLDWLRQAEIRPESLKKLKCIKLVHGTEDKIAPIEEAFDIAKTLPQAQFISFENTGHLPFLREDFNRRINEC